MVRLHLRLRWRRLAWKSASRVSPSTLVCDGPRGAARLHKGTALDKGGVVPSPCLLQHLVKLGLVLDVGNFGPRLCRKWDWLERVLGSSRPKPQ